MENEAGALSRVAGLFSARGYNIESLTVAPTEDPSLSRMTLVTSGTEDVIEQITKQLNKLVDVVKLMDMYECAHIEREMMLIKVRAVDAGRDEVKRLADIFRGRIIDVTDRLFTIEITGTSEKRYYRSGALRRHRRRARRQGAARIGFSRVEAGTPLTERRPELQELPTQYQGTTL
jgi:acetolactate synthase-1/3 small subunit